MVEGAKETENRQRTCYNLISLWILMKRKSFRYMRKLKHLEINFPHGKTCQFQQHNSHISKFTSQFIWSDGNIFLSNINFYQTLTMWMKIESYFKIKLNRSTLLPIRSNNTNRKISHNIFISTLSFRFMWMMYFFLFQQNLYSYCSKWTMKKVFRI